MAQRRKQRATGPGPDHQFKLRLPPDVATWIAQRAKAESKPMNRVIINALAAFPRLETATDHAELNEHMRVLIADYGSRLKLADLYEDLLAATDAVIAAEGSAALLAARDRLRVVRAAMLAMENDSRTATPQGGRETKSGQGARR